MRNLLTLKPWRRSRWRRGGLWVAGGLVLGSGVPLQAQSPNAAGAAAAETMDVEGVFELGRSLFEDYAPKEIKAEYRYPTRAEFDAFAVRLQRALQDGSLEELATYQPEARAALVALQAFPDYAPYAEWLRERLDLIEAAASAARHPSVPNLPSVPPSNPRRVAPTRPPEEVPFYNLWVQRLRGRPMPVVAPRWVPTLQPIFVQAGVPAGLVWLAEVESSFDPDARSPVGARGLFQFMPGTATEMGLRLRPMDERTDPRKSAGAAANYLKQLHGQFGSWPLALAAYNAGPGRVGRALKSRRATTYAAIADALPAETRMYVPKVLATVAARTGQVPSELGRTAAP